MRIGIISNSDLFIPLTHTLAAQKLQVYVFYSPSPDAHINQKVDGFISWSGLPFTRESNHHTDLDRWISANKIDVCFVLGYPHRITLNHHNGYSTRFFNIHFGNLPAFRGPVPVFWQLKLGVEKLGLVIHLLTEKIDEGPVVWTKETENLPHYNYQSVHLLFSQLCIEGVFFVLQCLLNKQSIPEKAQNPSEAAYLKKPGLSEVLIDWQHMGATEIINLIKACNPWNKGAVSFFKGQEVKLMDARILNQKTEDSPDGVIVNDADCLQIGCINGDLLSVNMIYFNDCYIPAYQVRQWGLVAGEQLGQPVKIPTP